jgi:hypothetical protein
MRILLCSPLRTEHGTGSAQTTKGPVIVESCRAEESSAPAPELLAGGEITPKEWLPSGYSRNDGTSRLIAFALRLSLEKKAKSHHENAEMPSHFSCDCLVQKYSCLALLCRWGSPLL